MIKQITDTDHIDSIIKKCRVIRVAWHDEPAPYLLPFNFGYVREGDQQKFYIHTGLKGKKLELTRQNKSVAFELDIAHELITDEDDCMWGMNFSSVTGTGNIRLLDKPAEKHKALVAIMKQYDHRENADYDFSRSFEKTNILEIEVLSLSAREKK